MARWVFFSCLFVTGATAISLSVYDSIVSTGTDTTVFWTWLSGDPTGFHIRVRLNNTGAHTGTNLFIHPQGNASGQDTYPISSSFDPGFYVFDAFLNQDPTGQTSSLYILSTSNSFQVIESLSTTVPPPPASSSSSTPNTFSSTSSTKPEAGLIIGSVLGGLAFFFLLFLVVVIVVRRNRKKLADKLAEETPEAYSESWATPFPTPRAQNRDVFVPSSMVSTSSGTSGSWPSEKPKSLISMSISPVRSPTTRQLQLRGELAERIAALEHAMQAQANETAVENARLRAEISWLRDQQESDWALGLTDEMPPSYPASLRPLSSQCERLTGEVGRLDQPNEGSIAGQ